MTQGRMTPADSTNGEKRWQLKVEWTPEVVQLPQRVPEYKRWLVTQYQAILGIQIQLAELWKFLAL